MMSHPSTDHYMGTYHNITSHGSVLMDKNTHPSIAALGAIPNLCRVVDHRIKQQENDAVNNSRYDWYVCKVKPTCKAVEGYCIHLDWAHRSDEGWRVLARCKRLDIIGSTIYALEDLCLGTASNAARRIPAFPWASSWRKYTSIPSSLL